MGDAAATRAELLRLLAPAVRGTGLDLEDVVVWRAGSRHLVRVVLDRDGGLDLDTVAEASRLVSSALDADDVLPGSYVLEVTSPGVDRPLTAPRHWRRATGRIVRVSCRGGRSLRGRVRDADDQGVRLSVDGRDVRLGYADVVRAVVEVELSRTEERP
ncbi:MAG TPA: ribosome maturation factor RimP [Frankiaceae bacterium]|nr:ribosome maturation factor RimP [Frankiaceae bacterium]